MSGKQELTRESGISESSWFMLIFSIIIAGIGLVTLYGYPMLLKQQTSADEQIMEKNMIVLQNDVKSLAYKTVPYTETSLKVGGGALTIYNASYDDTTTSSFTISDDGGAVTTGPPLPQTFHTGDLRYQSNAAETMISLENGAVVLRKVAQPGSTMLAEPRWFVDDTTNTAVIYLINFNSTEMLARSGVGTVQMAFMAGNYTEYSIPAGDKIKVTYTPNTDIDYSTAWSNYFKNTLKMSEVGGSPGVYRIPTDTSKPALLVVKQYEIAIKSL
jgi:hypothetical protein